MNKRLSVLAAATAAMMAFGTSAHAQSNAGVNVGSLTCNVAGGMGFVFGSSRDMTCIFTGNDGTAQRYKGTINRYGIDIGFTKEAQMVWLVFAPGKVVSGALAGKYAGPSAGVTAGVGVGVNALIGGGSNQVTLQPVSVEGNVGLNIAAGVGEMQLTPVS
jgi:Protein of unknown function (DUF992)